MDLTFTDVVTPPPVDLSSPDIEVWRDNEGRECAFGQTVAGENWMHIPLIGSFLLGDHDRPTSVVPQGGALKWQVIDTYYRNVLPMALQLLGQEILHASAVVTPQGVLTFCAPSETGKSTLAYGMRQRGNRLYADDAVVFDVNVDGRPQLGQVPFTIRLRKPSADYFGAESREMARVTGALDSQVGGAGSFAAICVLERLQGGRSESGSDPCSTGARGLGTNQSVVEVKRLSPSEAFAAVLPHAYCFTLRDHLRKRLMMKQYMALVGAVPVLHVRFRTGLEHLPEILDELERAVAEGYSRVAA
ncbi:MAG: hypothetical protein WD273_01905 [Trueperaceae bacterium]